MIVMSQSAKFFRLVATAGNALFIFWVLFNAMDSGFHGTGPEKASAVGLILLLSLNIVLINRRK